MHMETHQRFCLERQAATAIHTDFQAAPTRGYKVEQQGAPPSVLVGWHVEQSSALSS
jgi:hypothetical protein